MRPYGMKRTCEGCGCRLCRIAGFRVDAKLIVCKAAARREGKREVKYGVLAE